MKRFCVFNASKEYATKWQDLFQIRVNGGKSVSLCVKAFKHLFIIPTDWFYETSIRFSRNDKKADKSCSPQFVTEKEQLGVE